MLNPAGKLEALLEKVYEEEKSFEALVQGQKKYDIKKFRIQQLSIKKVLEMHYNISINSYRQEIIQKVSPWRQNQLKLFIWVLVLYTHYHKKSVQELEDPDWAIFQAIFNKDKIIFEYEAKCILKKKAKKIKWEKQEVQLFYQITQKYEFLSKWNKIAKQLFLHSNKLYFRTGKECRQYWNNHLNPVISHSSWALYEDFHLLLSVLKQGKKWAKIAKQLGGRRTEHMIKNRYKSLYNFERKNSSLEEEDEYIMMNRLKVKLGEKLEEEKGKEELNVWKEEEDKIYEGFFDGLH